nr:hypothetical protein [Oedogonium sp. 1_circle_61917]
MFQLLAFSQKEIEGMTGLLLNFCIITPKLTDVLHIQKELHLPKPPIFVVDGLDFEGIYQLKKQYKRVSGVYGWLCKQNNKCYVGSARDLSRRPFQHLIPSNKCNIVFKNALQKYGLSYFVLIIFEALGSRDDIPISVQFAKEDEYLQLIISKYNIHNTTKGYIESCLENPQRFTKGRLWTDESKKKLSNSVSGEKNPFFGKKHTEDSIKKMADSRRGAKHYRAKAVILTNLETNQIIVINTLIGAASFLGYKDYNQIYSSIRSESGIIISKDRKSRWHVRYAAPVKEEPTP